ncbi:MAG: peptidoglycan D,D-transpeptidase FtsI family protein [Planctomycetota bacterium]|jgi:penicillin-binding protein 2
MRVFAIVIAAMIAVVLLRLGHFQIIRAGQFRNQAEGLLTYTVTLPAPRGRIVDRNGMFLARNQPVWSLCLDYRFMTDDPDWIDAQLLRIQRTEGVNSPDRAEEIYRRRRDATYRLAYELAAQQNTDLDAVIARTVRNVKRLRERVGQEVREERQVHPVVTGLETPLSTEQTIGTVFRPEQKRFYPREETACHIVGVLGRVTRERLEGHNLPADQGDYLTRLRHNYEPDDRLGISGVERMCEEVLRGRRGYRQARRMAQSEATIAEVLAVDGQDVRLTLDVALQQDLTRLFEDMAEGHNGSAVVVAVGDNPAMGVRAGEILSMVSIPTYDLNAYHADYAALARETGELPLNHRAVAALYPPGSTAKPIAALAGLSERVIDLNTVFNCRGFLHSPDAFRCWIYKYGAGHGDLNVTGAMKHSCNVFLYNVGELMGVPRLHYWYEKFGFTGVSGTGLAEEVRGRVADSGSVGSPARHMAIGQGPVACTPLHVADAMATIARRGRRIAPAMVIEPDSAAPPRTAYDLGIPESDMAAVIEGMFQVVNSSGGTAYKVFHGQDVRDGLVEPLSVVVCGKTGTAQAPPLRVDSDGDGRITGDDVIVREGDMAWFAGFAPREDPKIAFAVVVEYITEGGGASVAAPIGREIVRQCRRHGYVGVQP